MIPLVLAVAVVELSAQEPQSDTGSAANFAVTSEQPAGVENVSALEEVHVLSKTRIQLLGRV